MTEESRSPNRRQFLQAVSLVGAAAFVPGNARAEGVDDGMQIRNESFIAEYDPKSGRLNILNRDGTPFLTRVDVGAFGPSLTRKATDADYARKGWVEPVSDTLGTGSCLRVVCSDTKKQLDLEFSITLYNGLRAVILETVARNASTGEDLALERIDPVSVSGDLDSGLCWAGIQKVLTNGRMYYDPGKVLDLTPDTEITGWWNLGFHPGVWPFYEYFVV